MSEPASQTDPAPQPAPEPVENKDEHPLVRMRKLHGDKVTNISDEDDSNVGGKKKTKKRKSNKKKTKKRKSKKEWKKEINSKF